MAKITAVIIEGSFGETMTFFDLLEKDELVAFTYSELQRRLPGFRVVEKEGSCLMRLLGRLLFFNSRFMTHYTTTIGRTVYTPSGKESTRNSAVATLLHEAVHSADWKLALVIYLMPQSLSLLAILSIFFGPWWLIALLFLLPFPSYGRAYIEARGYGMTIAAFYALGDYPHIATYVEQFTGPAYYWMMPFRCIVAKMLDRYATRPAYFASVLAALEEVTNAR